MDKPRQQDDLWSSSGFHALESSCIQTGAVFTIGRSRFADNVASHFFIRKDPVVNITCGDEHSAVVCQSGRLFVFGSNDWGQLGLGHKNHVSKPSCVKILKPEKVTHVACGRAHTLICTGAQKIFACGSDQEGQLGRGTGAIGDSSSVPVLVYDCGLVGPKVIQVVAGSHHSMALTGDGGVVAWGSNLEGQLGLSGISGLVNKPTKVPIPEPVKEISAGYYHSAFLTESGLVYVCGESESGKLGIDVSFSTQVAPKQMQLPGPAAHVACGGHHTLILGENGSIYCVGSNASGQLGMGTSVTDIQAPKLLPQGALRNEPINKIVTGESHSAVLTTSGKLFTCGDGRHGKLGLEENENNVHELTFAAKYQELFISNVSCGGCHTILVGRRRETDDLKQEETQSEQTDQPVQKKNPLPPLKLPVNRLQSKEKTDETEKNEINSEKMNSDESKKDHLPQDATENSSNEPKQNGDLTSSDEINETPKKATDVLITEIVDAEIDQMSKTAEDEKKDKATSSMEKDVQNNKEKPPMYNTIENNVDHAEISDSTVNGIPSISEENEKIKEGAKELGIKAQEELSSEKEMSSPGSMPPPKPPRQKVTSLEGSPENQAKAAMNLTKTEETPAPENSSENVVASNNKVQNNMDNDKPMQNDEGSPAKVSMASEKSARSKADTDETIEVETQNVIETSTKSDNRMAEEVKQETDNVDDADVVQSPPPRTSKMAKLFKTKRQQNMENGTKSLSTSNPKAKSKTCSIL